MHRRETVTREEIYRRLDAERAFPESKIPDDAYQKAWEHIQQMPAASEPPESAPNPTTEPQSRDQHREYWLAQILTLFSTLLSPAPAAAQTTPWTEVGPFHFLDYNNQITAGMVKAVTIDPGSTQRIYVGSPFGGSWKSGNGGGTWTPMTDFQPSSKPALSIQSIAVHPTDADLILMGTDPVYSGGGVVRTIDRGATWCQIGPTFGATPLSVYTVLIDTTKSQTRVWAATSSGLWWSENAQNFTAVPWRV